jgi:hypothetical protein
MLYLPKTAQGLVVAATSSSCGSRGDWPGVVDDRDLGWTYSVGERLYLVSPATRLIVVAMMSVPNA